MTLLQENCYVTVKAKFKDREVLEKFEQALKIIKERAIYYLDVELKTAMYMLQDVAQKIQIVVEYDDSGGE